ncbi:MAG: PAS domain S-box protein, partial [Promethearchaeota archaeon]
MEQTLAESERKFRTIFNAIPDLFFLVNEDSTILEYSGKQDDLYLPPEQFLGKKMIDVLPNDTSELFKKTINKTLQSKKPQILEYLLPIKNEKKHFEARHLPFTGNKIAIFIRNITEKKEAEEKLKKSEEKYRKAFNQAELYKDLFYHDMNNILSNIGLSVDLSEKWLNEPWAQGEIKKYLGLIKGQFVR